MESNAFTWIAFYEEFASKLLPYKEDREKLIEKIRNVFERAKMPLPTLDKDNYITDIDPFTIFGLFNKGITDANRIRLAESVKAEFGIAASVPRDFKGIPVLNNMAATFYRFCGERSEHDIDNLWHIFETAILMADEETKQNRQSFISAYDTVRHQNGIRWNLTMGMYWIRPNAFISLDARNRQFIKSHQKELPDIFVSLNDTTLPDANAYLSMRDALLQVLSKTENIYKNFPTFSQAAWDEQHTDWEPANYTPYTADNFLSEVYMTDTQYHSLAARLRKKKNIILQGAPGVGKTFAAKRLAYSLMGEKDAERVMVVQFHQSYAYEDFIMGYRPTENGFQLQTGAFYNFCKKAADDSENDYYFIIDEINRGNLNKIFGELFLLLEADKRGEEVQLLYKDEKFSVPPNLYLIGTMNTADRSLAMLDYALRRRFSFFDMAPGFETKGFKTYQAELSHPKLDRLVQCVERLNAAITEDETLGEGFCIGHSYFCGLKAEEMTDETFSAIVEYDILPLIKEYWFDEPSKVRDWSEQLRSALR